MDDQNQDRDRRERESEMEESTPGQLAAKYFRRIMALERELNALPGVTCEIAVEVTFPDYWPGKEPEGYVPEPPQYEIEIRNGEIVKDTRPPEMREPRL